MQHNAWDTYTANHYKCIMIICKNVAVCWWQREKGQGRLQGWSCLAPYGKTARAKGYYYTMEDIETMLVGH